MRSFLMAGTPVNGCNIIFVLLHEGEDGKSGFLGGRFEVCMQRQQLPQSNLI